MEPISEAMETAILEFLRTGAAVHRAQLESLAKQAEMAEQQMKLLEQLAEADNVTVLSADDWDELLGEDGE